MENPRPCNNCKKKQFLCGGKEGLACNQCINTRISCKYSEKKLTKHKDSYLEGIGNRVNLIEKSISPIENFRSVSFPGNDDDLKKIDSTLMANFGFDLNCFDKITENKIPTISELDGNNLIEYYFKFINPTLLIINPNNFIQSPLSRYLNFTIYALSLVFQLDFRPNSKEIINEYLDYSKTLIENTNENIITLESIQILFLVAYAEYCLGKLTSSWIYCGMAIRYIFIL